MRFWVSIDLSYQPSLPFSRLWGKALLNGALCLTATFLLASCAENANVQPEVTGPSIEETQGSEIEVAALATDPLLETEVVIQAPLDNTIRVGFLAPLSGRHKATGEALLNAAQLAFFDLGDDRFRVLIADTGGTPEGARLAARSLLDQGAQLLLGPLFADSVRTVGREVLYRNVSVIGFSNDSSAATPGVFVMGLSPEAQIERMVAYASAQGLFRIATLVPANDFGRRSLAALQNAAFQYSVEITDFGFYDPVAEDLTPEVIRIADYKLRHKELLEEREKLEEQGGESAEALLKHLENLDTLSPPEYDALLLPLGGRHLLTLASLFAFYDVDPVDVRYLGTNLWRDPALLREPTLQGGWFPAPPSELWDLFKNRYKDAYGTEPPRIAGLGYDATALAAVLARQGPEEVTSSAQVSQYQGQGGATLQNEGATSRSLSQPALAGPPTIQRGYPTPISRPTRFSEDRITNASGFAGIDGIFRFLPDGRVERVFSVFEVGDNGFREIDSARKTFQDFVN